MGPSGSKLQTGSTHVMTDLGLGASTTTTTTTTTTTFNSLLLS